MTKDPVVISFVFHHYTISVLCKTFNHTFLENAILGLVYLNWFPSIYSTDRFMSKQLNPTPNFIHNLEPTYSPLISKVQSLLTGKEEIYQSVFQQCLTVLYNMKHAKISSIDY